MVYIFKKLNNLTGDVNPPSAGSVIGSGGSTSAGASPSTTPKDPYASTYRNPNKMYSANLGEDQGQVETGLSKNITDTQNELTKSSDNYQSNLNTIDKKYQYNGQQDLDNVGDSNTFSRLNSILTPTAAQSELNATQSNTRNYAPDTSGVAAASTVGGLSNQLQKQYGTSAGGSRLDAQLYRGSGQAGQAINQNLKQIEAFQGDKTNRLANEQALLTQYNQGATDRSTQLGNDAGAYQTNLLNQAQTKASQTQSTYDAQRQAAIDGLKSGRDSNDVNAILQKAINEAFGDNKLFDQYRDHGPGIEIAGKSGTAPTPITDISMIPRRPGSENPQDTLSRLSRYLQDKGVDGAAANNLVNITKPTLDTSYGNYDSLYNFDLTDYFKGKVLNQFSPQVDLNQFDPSKYVESASQFNQDMYLDPRFNQLSQLLGKDQRVAENPLDTDVTSRGDEYNKQIQEYLGQQTGYAKDAVSRLLNPSQISTDKSNPYITALAETLRNNPSITGASLVAGTPIGNLGGRPFGDFLAEGTYGIGGALDKPFSKIGGMISGAFGGW